MKKLLLAVGIILIAACVISLLFAALQLFGYYHVMDGSAALYHRLQQRAIVFLVTGIVLAALGTVCMIVRRRL